MARPKRRRVQVGDTIILRNPSVPDHPTMPVTIDGKQTIIPAGLVGQVVEVGWWSSAKLVVDLGGGVLVSTGHGVIAGWLDESR